MIIACMLRYALIISIISLFLFGSPNLARGIEADSHVHIKSPHYWGKLGGAFTSKDVIRMIDDASVDLAGVISSAYLISKYESAKFENDYVAAIVKEHPTRFVGYCSVRVLESWAVNEVERCGKKLELRALKLHLGENSVDITNPDHYSQVKSIIGEAESAGFSAILLDWDRNNPESTKSLLFMTIRHPKMNFVLAHGLDFSYKQLKFIGRTYELEPSLPRNLFVDLSVAIRFFVKDPDRKKDYLKSLRAFGMERVLFGSDSPVMSTAEAKSYLSRLGLNDKEKKMVIGDNFARLFELSMTKPQSGSPTKTH